MERRKFLIGVGGTAIGGSALVGSGAFSRVESHRSVTINVANDKHAYVGLRRADSENSRNYTHLDGNGHGYIEITDSGHGGEGVNSNSYTFFDDLFEIHNQGKEDAYFCIDTSGLTGGEAVESGTPGVEFYVNEESDGSDGERAQGSNGKGAVDGNELECDGEGGWLIPVGEYITVGLMVDTTGLDIDKNELTGSLVDGDAVLLADVDAANSPST